MICDVLLEEHDVFLKKGLRVSGGIRKSPFTGGAEAHDGAPDGAAARRKRGADADEAARHSRGMTGGAPEVRAHWSGFCLSRCLTSLISEEICGRPWFIRWIKRLYIALLGFRPDDEVSASLFVRLLVFLGKPGAHQTDDFIRFSHRMRCAEVRTSRITEQSVFNLRV